MLPLLLSAGAIAAAVTPEFIEHWWPEKAAAAAAAAAGSNDSNGSTDIQKPSKPRSCSLAEVLLTLQYDVSGVADMHLGTSWLHEAVR